MNTTFLLMAGSDGRMYMSIDELCAAIGYAKQTAYNEISTGRFPIPMQKRAGKLMADIRDVAAYLDREREQAREKHEELKAKMGAVA
jgi:hypothetical protein